MIIACVRVREPESTFLLCLNKFRFDGMESVFVLCVCVCVYFFRCEKFAQRLPFHSICFVCSLAACVCYSVTLFFLFFPLFAVCYQVVFIAIFPSPRKMNENETDAVSCIAVTKTCMNTKTNEQRWSSKNRPKGIRYSLLSIYLRVARFNMVRVLCGFHFETIMITNRRRLSIVILLSVESEHSIPTERE